MLPKSKYLPFFKENAARLKETMEIQGDILLIERLKFPEEAHKVGSLYIADSRKTQSSGFTSEVPEFYRVLMVGAGHYNPDTNEDVPLDISQGDIIYTAAASVKLWSKLPFIQSADSDVLGETNHGAVHVRWKTEEAFEAFLRDFNLSIKNQMEARQG